jgi:predicted dehydrogenase
MTLPTSRRAFLGASAVGIGAAALGRPAFAQSATRSSAASSAAGDAPPPGPEISSEPTGRPEPKLTAEQPLPPEERLGWAVAGLGNFAQERMIPAIAQSRRAKLTGLVSGNAEKARGVASRYEVENDAIYDYAMTGLENDDRTAVVYVITANVPHEEPVIRALEAGKHVMCEKPFGGSSASCERMLDAARANDRKIMVAYRAHFEPHNQALKTRIDNGELGEILYASGSHHRPIEPDRPRDVWRMQKDVAGGGSLFDIGIYSLNGILWFFGESPSALVANTYRPEGDPRFAEVEGLTQVQMVFPSGRRADFSSGYVGEDNRIAVIGKDATALLNPATAYEGNDLTIKRQSANETVTTAPSEAQFAGEVDHFCEAIQEGTEIRTPGEMGLRDVRIMEAIYRSAETGAWVNLNPDGTIRG